MKIYIASSWKNERTVLAWATHLRSLGYETDAFVDASKGRYVFHYSEIGDVDDLDCISFLEDERSQKAFQEDKNWLDWADVCLLILPAGKSSHLEAGYAKGCGKKLIIYQDEFPKGSFDVMYGFADLLSDDPVEVARYLSEREGKG